jgi:hypothetical protein
MAQQDIKLGASGLVSNPNYLSNVPDAAMSEAKNVVIDRPGIIEPRRGLPIAYDTVMPAGTDRALRLSTYQDKIVATYTGNKLAYLTTSGPLSGNGSWTTFSGTYPPVDSTTNQTRFAKAGGSLFFTSSVGLYKLDALTSTPVLAGGLMPIPAYAVVYNDATYNWLANGSTVAYRIIITHTDTSGRLIRGVPSGRMLFTNTAGATRCATLQINLPLGITVSHTIEVYRSSADTAGAPSDDLGLVYQFKPSAFDVNALNTSCNDIVPDVLRGQSLYTNARQDGINQAAARPMLCNDIALFGSSLWTARTTSLQRLILQLVGTGATAGVQVNDRIVIEGRSYIAAAAENISTYQFLCDTSGTVTSNIRNTVQSLINCINNNALNKGLSGVDTALATNLSADTETPGKLLVEAEKAGYNQFFAGASGNYTAWQPALPRAFQIAIGGLVRTSNVVTATTTASHGYTTGDTIYIAANNPNVLLPVGQKTITVTGATTFTYAETAANATSTVAYDTLKVNGTNVVKSSNVVGKNRLAFSRDDEFEAFPEENEFFLGSADAEILRIVPTKDSLWIFKEDGLWRITGFFTGNYAAQCFDPTLRLYAPDSAVPLNGQVFAWTNQGVVAISESGVRVLDTAIADKLKELQVYSSTLALGAFGIGYESDGKYYLVAGNPADTAWIKAYVYNFRTDTWTTTEIQHVINHGIIDDQMDNKIYLASASQAYLIRENKALTASDYSDSYNSSTGVQTGSVAAVVTWVPNVGKNPGVVKHWRNLNIWFRNAPTSDQTANTAVSWNSDWTGSVSAAYITVPANLKTVRVEVPLNQRRCEQLQVGLTMVASPTWVQNVLGAQLTFNASGQKAGK